MDWAKATEKEKQPPAVKPTWKELFAQLADNAKKQKAHEAWKSETLVESDVSFKAHPAHAACEQYLTLWNQRNYGKMATMLSRMVQSAYGAGMPRQIRQEYSAYDLSTFDLIQIDQTAPAVCEVEARLLLNSSGPRTVRLRWIYEDDDGEVVTSSLPGAWGLMVWGPAAFLAEEQARDTSEGSL